MKVASPINTSKGWVHQTSARMVSPNDRRGSAVVSFIDYLLLLPAASPFSMLPNYRNIPQIGEPLRLPDTGSDARPIAAAAGNSRRFASVEVRHSLGQVRGQNVVG